MNHRQMVCSRGCLLAAAVLASALRSAGAQATSPSPLSPPITAPTPRHWVEASLGNVGGGVPLWSNVTMRATVAWRTRMWTERVQLRVAGAWTPVLGGAAQMAVSASGLLRVVDVPLGRARWQPYVVGGVGDHALGTRTIGTHLGAGLRLATGRQAVQLEWLRQSGRDRNALMLGMAFGLGSR